MEDKANVFCDGSYRVVLCVHPVYEDRTLRRLKEAVYVLYQGRLACAILPQNRDELAIPYQEVDIVENGASRQVGVGYALESNHLQHPLTAYSSSSEERGFLTVPPHGSFLAT